MNLRVLDYEITIRSRAAYNININFILNIPISLIFWQLVKKEDPSSRYWRGPFKLNILGVRYY